jgi:hypothetical protein
MWISRIELSVLVAAALVAHSLSPHLDQSPTRYLIRGIIESIARILASGSGSYHIWGKGAKELAAEHLLSFRKLRHNECGVYST